MRLPPTCVKSRCSVILVLAATLAACQPGWLRLDGASAGEAELQQAQAYCQVADKLAALDATRDDDNTQDGAVNDNEARMLRLEDYDSRKRRVQAEIEACMQQQGFRPGG